MELPTGMDVLHASHRDIRIRATRVVLTGVEGRDLVLRVVESLQRELRDLGIVPEEILPPELGGNRIGIDNDEDDFVHVVRNRGKLF